MTKRIVTRIGDVFCVEVDDNYKCYFQYIAKDMESLNSSTIRVFKTKYPLEYEPVIDEIVNDEVAFYSHTVLRWGISDNIWYKVGNSNQLGDFDDILFGCTNDDRFENDSPFVSSDWWVWRLGQEAFKVGRLKGIYKNVEMGDVFPYTEILERIRTGKYAAKFPL